MLFRPTASNPTSARSTLRRIAVALLASAAIATTGVTTDALAFGRGGGGGGGFHGGGGGFHGGGGGFHGGGFGGFHGGSLGGFHGAGGFRGFAAHGFAEHGFAARSFAGHGAVGHALTGHGFAGRGFAGHGFAGRSFAHRGFVGHAPGGHRFAGRGLGGNHFAGHGRAGNAGHFASRQGFAGGRNGVAGHNGLGRAGQFGGPGQVSHNQLGANQVGRGQFAHNAIGHNQFAHNEFAAQHFHGLNNFNRTGFNRNAFGNGQGWNQWGGNFWGAGWDNWGSGWGGWAGPVFWPFLYGDIFSFAFWPYDYYDPFWAFGPEFILASIFAPGPYFGLDYGYGPDYYGYAYGSDYYGYPGYGYGGFPNIYYGNYGGSGYAGGRSNVGGQRTAKLTQADREALAETNAEAVQSCTGLAPGVTDLPIEQIKETVHPRGDQEVALDDLSTASSKADDIIKSSCPTEMPLTPVGRLDAAQERLEAMIKAIRIIRPPLERFYGSLSGEQRHQFDAMGSAGRQGEGAETSTPSGGNLAGICSRQTGDFAKLPTRRIEGVVDPTGQQRDAFNDLRKASEDVASQLQASCPTVIPQTPVARLEAVETRLNAMVSALRSIRPELKNFYASLSDEQKARFNAMGPEPSAPLNHQGSQ